MDVVWWSVNWSDAAGADSFGYGCLLVVVGDTDTVDSVCGASVVVDAA